MEKEMKTYTQEQIRKAFELWVNDLEPDAKEVDCTIPEDASKEYTKILIS